MENLNKMSVLLKDLGNGIKSVIINDPKTYNSLSFKTLGSLIKIFKKLNNDNKTHVIVISGNGKGFSAGHNLKEVKGLKVRSKYLKVLEVAKVISSKSNASIRIGKKAFYKQLEMPLKQAYTYTSKMMTLNMMKQDAKEGISAFLGKRSPKWKNK